MPTCQQQSEFALGAQKISKATVLQKSETLWCPLWISVYFVYVVLYQIFFLYADFFFYFFVVYHRYKFVCEWFFVSVWPCAYHTSHSKLDFFFLWRKRKCIMGRSFEAETFHVVIIKTADWCLFNFVFLAIDYIHFLHKEKKKQEEEVSLLRKEVMALKIMKTYDSCSHSIKAEVLCLPAATFHCS